MTIHPLRINVARTLLDGPPATLPTASDEAAADKKILIVRIAAGDKRAMQALYRRHHVRLYRFVLRFVRDRQLAEDLVSEAFLDVWRHASTFEARRIGGFSISVLVMPRLKACWALSRAGRGDANLMTPARRRPRTRVTPRR